MTGACRIFRFPNDFYKAICDTDDEHSISVADAEKKVQVKYLREYLAELGCKSILVESQYVDHDYLDDYANYYVKCFSPYRRFCNRAHFWTCEISETVIDEAVLNDGSAEFQQLLDSYLGFVVIKPLPSAIIGRTVLRTYATDGGQRVFETLRPYPANLFGMELEFPSLAFQEQDTVLAACATTALWSAFQQTSRLYNTSAPTPSEITKSATKYVQTTRPIPNRGLSIEQMCYAISENGLTPEVFQLNPDTPVSSLLYSYVSAKLPVILGYCVVSSDQYHAVTVSGYRLAPAPMFPAETLDSSIGLNLVGRRISKFYVHDDTLGPFSRLHCLAYIGTGSVNPRQFGREGSSGYLDLICQPLVAIVPIYHKIRLRFTEIQGAIRELDRYFKTLGIDLVDAANPHGLEWDIRLTELTQLREEVRDEESIDTDTKRRLLFSSRPKYNWVSTARLYGQSLFSIISDATDMERSFCLDEVFFRTSGIRKSIGETIEAYDPRLDIALSAQLPSTFLKFIKRSFLKAK